MKINLKICKNTGTQQTDQTTVKITKRHSENHNIIDRSQKGCKYIRWAMIYEKSGLVFEKQTIL